MKSAQRAAPSKSMLKLPRSLVNRKQDSVREPVLRKSISSSTAAQEEGTYRNPILSADYPDPDVIRVGSDFYLVASSFHCTPGLPILHSSNLVDWKIVNHAVRNLPHSRFDEVQPGCGIWAPSIREHLDRFWIFFAMPDEGIYCTSAEHPTAEWSPPHLIQEGCGLIDPCPFWDDDGKAYLAHAYAHSRSGIRHKLRVRPMCPDCSELLGEGRIIFDDPQNHPTIEGPKFLKREDYYYILAPAGGVESGWQLALRSRHIYGPYDVKIILEQGSTSVNGPHQGALVDTPAGEWWFLHFQDTKPVGRIVHLQPACWKNGWPSIGIDHDGNGIGEPVTDHPMPRLALPLANNEREDHRFRDDFTTLGASDSFGIEHFDSAQLALPWHWNANHNVDWYSLTDRPGWLRLFAQPSVHSTNAMDFVRIPNVLLRKFPGKTFTAETRLNIAAMGISHEAGIAVLGRQSAAITLRRINRKADSSELEIKYLVNAKIVVSSIQPHVPMILKLTVTDGRCVFSHHPEGAGSEFVSEPFQAVEGLWTGAKMGLFAVQPSDSSQSAEVAYSDFDYFRMSP